MSITGTRISITLSQLFSVVAVLVSLSVAVGAYRSDFSMIQKEQIELVVEIKALSKEMSQLRESFARVGQKLDDHITADAKIVEQLNALR